MMIGMAVVFVFLLLLIIYMKFVPILSEINIFRSSNKKDQQKLKINSMLNELSVTSDTSRSTVSDPEIAAIAAAIYSHTGKKPKKLVITTPSGKIESYNLWGVAGRQDLMASRDVTGQVGFQY
jgi:sodium pump decarboxylase gamma subunit